MTEPLHVHRERRALLRGAGGAVDRRGGDRRGGARERDVPFAAEQSARGVEPDPARARQIHLGPRVQIDDVAGHAARRVRDHPLVDELHQVSADETRREAPRAKRCDQQRRRVATASAPLGERLLR